MASRQGSRNTSRSNSGDSKKSAKSTKSTRSDKSLPLTLGCEFECVFAYWKPQDERGVIDSRDKKADDRVKKKRREMQEKRAEMVIRTIISSKPYQVECTQCGKAIDWYVRVSDPTISDPADMWHVDFDGDTPPSDNEMFALGNDISEYTIVGIEIKTRKLLHGQVSSGERVGGCDHTISFRTEITMVIDRLNKRLCKLTNDGFCDLFGINGATVSDDQMLARLNDDSKQAGYLYVNDRASFHVHIGNLDGQLSDATVQYTLAALLAWERQIDRLHACNRITGLRLPSLDHQPKTNNTREFYDLNVYNLPLSFQFMQQAHVTRLKLGDPDQDSRTDPKLQYNFDAWLKLLSSATTIPGLQFYTQKTNLPKACVININNLEFPGGNTGKLRTIEFRQSLWTLDVKATLSFIDSVTKLVRFCHEKAEHSNETVEGLFGWNSSHDHMSQSSINILNLLECEKSTIEYFQGHINGGSSAIKRIDKLKMDMPVLKKETEHLRGLTRLILQNIADQKANFLPQKIEERINKKLMDGGYGYDPAKLHT